MADSSQDIRFVPAQVSDAASLARMNQQLIRDSGHRNPMSLAALEQRMATWLRGEYRAVLIFHHHRAVGYALYRQDADWLAIRQLFVLPDHRRRGLARATIDWLRHQPELSVPRLRIEVLVDNQPAIAFWRAMGFHDYALTMEWEPSAPAGEID